jgi:hypothetical protein
MCPQSSNYIENLIWDAVVLGGGGGLLRGEKIMMVSTSW